MRKSIKKRIEVVLLVLIVVIMGVYIQKGDSRTKHQTPDIIFAFSREDWTADATYRIWYIDKNGNVYHTKNESYYSIWSALQRYDEMITDPTCQIVKTVDPNILKEKYRVLRAILHGGKNKEIDLNENSYNVPEVYRGINSWLGCCCDYHGNDTVINLLSAGDSPLENQDPRAKRLVFWLIKCLDLDNISTSTDLYR